MVLRALTRFDFDLSIFTKFFHKFDLIYLIWVS